MPQIKLWDDSVVFNSSKSVKIVPGCDFQRRRVHRRVYSIQGNVREHPSYVSDHHVWYRSFPWAVRAWMIYIDVPFVFRPFWPWQSFVVWPYQWPFFPFSIVWPRHTDCYYFLVHHHHHHHLTCHYRILEGIDHHHHHHPHRHPRNNHFPNQWNHDHYHRNHHRQSNPATSFEKTGCRRHHHPIILIHVIAFHKILEFGTKNLARSIQLIVPLQSSVYCVLV